MNKEEMDKLAKSVAQALGSQKDEWESAVSPMKTEITLEKVKSLDKLVSHPKPAKVAQKELLGFKTHTFLDVLFLNAKGKSLMGIPIVSQIGVTGLPSSGKSILIEEIAITVAHEGKKVLLVTSEDSWESQTQRFDLQARLKQKADILGLEWAKISQNLFVLDTVSNTELRSWQLFAQTYRYVCEKEKIELVLVDSVTLLETYRGALKFRLQELCRYNQRYGITAIYINQRAKETWDVREMAGGIGLGHILDSTVIIDYGRTYHTTINQDLDTKRGTDVRIVRVLGCRLCAFVGNYQEVEITKDGLLRMKPKTQVQP